MRNSRTVLTLGNLLRYKAKFEVTLRLAVYRLSLRLCAKSLETEDQNFFFLATEPLL
jgi:hypothetical protein